jgi:CBS domain-containing protein
MATPWGPSGGSGMFKAKKIMTTDVCTIREDTSIREAMQLLLEKNVTGLPVLSEDGRLKGIVTEKDMLNQLYNSKMEDTPVSSIMTSEVVTFDENDDLIDVCEAMINSHFRRVPILSGGKLAGVISRKDIIGFINSLRHADKNEAAEG